MIKNKVPDLLKEREMNISDLMRGLDVTYVTAYKLAKASTTSIRFDVLEKLCKFFEVETSQILEYTPDK